MENSGYQTLSSPLKTLGTRQGRGLVTEMYMKHSVGRGISCVTYVCLFNGSSGATGAGGDVEVVAWRILAALALGQRREIKKSVTEVCYSPPYLLPCSLA